MQTDLEFTRTHEATITANGSRWFGQEPAPVDELLAVLAAEPLSRRFEIYGNFIIADGDGSTRFWGNFAAISHVFCVDTNDPEIIERLTTAIRANQQTAAYLAQPVPEPLPRCSHCTWAAGGALAKTCGRH